MIWQCGACGAHFAEHTDLAAHETSHGSEAARAPAG